MGSFVLTLICLDVFLGIIILSYHCDTSKTRLQDEASVISPESLQFVFGIYRHGVRAPAFPSYSTDPYKDYSEYFPEGDGALTKSGKQLMYRVGRTLHKRYSSFLGPNYSKDKVHFISTNMERTMMSALLVSNGIFPPKTYQQWSDNINWQPIPIWLDNNGMDKTLLFMNSSSCPRFKSDLSNVETKAKELDSTTDRLLLYQYISEHAGEKVNSTYQLLSLWDVFECEKLNGYELPQWATTVFPDQLKSLVAKIFSAMVNETKPMARILSGPIFYFLNDLLTAKKNGSLDPDWKMYLHAGHDITILAFLNGLGLPEQIIVRPGDSVLVELHYVPYSYYIKVLYLSPLERGEVLEEVAIPGCGSPCELDTFISIPTVLSPEAWTAECIN